MTLKRPADDMERTIPRPRRGVNKRTKLEPSADERSNSSVASSCSVSEDSALQSSPPASTRDRMSSMSSLASDDSNSDSESSVSSDSDSDASDQEEDITVIGGPKKPDIRRMRDIDGSDDLKTRLAALLPQLEEANSLLKSDAAKYSMENVEDGEQHIEMNLGLGVLEQQREDDESSGSDDSESSEEDLASDLPVSSGALKEPLQDKETRYMDRLTGVRPDAKHASIEEIG